MGFLDAFRLYELQRPYCTLGGEVPIDRVCELLPKTPLGESTSWADPNLTPNHRPRPERRS